MKCIAIIISLIGFIQFAFAQQAIITVSGNENGKDASTLVKKAIQKCKEEKSTKLVFPKGRYDFWPDYSSEKYVFVSNNDHGLKNILFDLSGMRNIEIDGGGSEFVFHGYICPFLIENASNIILRNFSIDYARTFHSEGIIVGSYKDSLDVSISAHYPFKVTNGRLMFYDEIEIEYPYWHLLEFSAKKREVAVNARDYITGVEQMLVKNINDSVVRLFLKGLQGENGNTLVFNSKYRQVPAIIITNSKDIGIINCTIFHSGGMGVIGQLSRNILLDGLVVVPAPGRMISVTADPTHFVNCSGDITIINCRMENQMDDAGNIHNIYARVDQVISPEEVIVELVHYQQAGIGIFSPRSNVEFVASQNLVTIHENTVASVERINRKYTRLVFNNPIDTGIRKGCLIGSLDHSPNLLIKNCVVKNNRARGFLLGTKGKIIVENNYFHTWWGALDFYANGNDWYEQGGVRDVVIRNNIFDNCNYGLNVGMGVIIDLLQLKMEPPFGNYYHKNILIENNLFKVFNPNILTLVSIDGLFFRKNIIQHTTAYELPDWLRNQKIEPFDFKYSRNIHIE